MEASLCRQPSPALLVPHIVALPLFCSVLFCSLWAAAGSKELMEYLRMVDHVMLEGRVKRYEFEIEAAHLLPQRPCALFPSPSAVQAPRSAFDSLHSIWTIPGSM